MKTHIRIATLLILVLSVSTTLYAQKNLEVTIKNIKETTGTIRVGLFNNENDFLKSAMEGKVVKASASEITVVFKNLNIIKNEF